MKNPVKIFIDSASPPKGWIGVKNFSDLDSLFGTVKLSDIAAVSFSDNLEEDDYDDLSAYNGYDCAVRLIEIADGRELPQTFIHSVRKSEQIKSALDHYTKSHKFENFCIEHTIEEIF